MFMGFRNSWAYLFNDDEGMLKSLRLTGGSKVRKSLHSCGEISCVYSTVGGTVPGVRRRQCGYRGDFAREGKAGGWNSDNAWLIRTTYFHLFR